MSDLKPGDRALVVGIPDRPYQFLNGRVVIVGSEPFMPDPKECSRPPRGLIVKISQGLEPYDALEPMYLIRIPPDSEMRQRERETEKLVAA